MSASGSSYQRLPQAGDGDAEPLLTDSQYPTVRLSREQEAADKREPDGDSSPLLGQSSSTSTLEDDDVPHNATTSVTSAAGVV